MTHEKMIMDVCFLRVLIINKINIDGTVGMVGMVTK